MSKSFYIVPKNENGILIFNHKRFYVDGDYCTRKAAEDALPHYKALFKDVNIDATVIEVTY